jgi:hypothetical protein
MSADHPDLDGFSLILEKIEHLINMALEDGDTHAERLFIVMTMIADYVGQLRQISAELSERGACR